MAAAATTARLPAWRSAGRAPRASQRAPRAGAQPTNKTPRATRPTAHALAGGDGGDGRDGRDHGGRGGGGGGDGDDDASRRPRPLSFAAALPCFSLAAAGDPPPVVTHGKAVRPFIDTRKALDLLICVLLPAFGIFLHQNNVADKHVYLALGLMALGPAAWVLGEAGLLSASAMGPWVRVAVANSYYAAQAVAILRVFFGLNL